MFKQLNSCSFKKIVDLKPNTVYKIKKFRSIDTRYGAAILVELVNFDNEIILSSRYSKFLSQLDEFNQKLSSGEKLVLIKNQDGTITFQEGN